MDNIIEFTFPIDLTIKLGYGELREIIVSGHLFAESLYVRNSGRQRQLGKSEFRILLSHINQSFYRLCKVQEIALMHSLTGWHEQA